MTDLSRDKASILYPGNVRKTVFIKDLNLPLGANVIRSMKKEESTCLMNNPRLKIGVKIEGVL